MSNMSRSEEKGIRLWLGIVAIMILLFMKYLLPVINPELLLIAVMGGLAGSFIVLIWWIFFSRIPRFERWIGFAFLVITNVGSYFLLHNSVRTGFGGLMFLIYSLPFTSIALVIWAALYKYLNKKNRRILLALMICASCSIWFFVRSEGINGSAKANFAWRWSKTDEEILLANNDNAQFDSSLGRLNSALNYNWSGFRGENRDGKIPDITIETDWNKYAPEEIWRTAIGPGCSSFAVDGNLLYTQEQRGEEEVVSCYDLATGAIVWTHSDNERFWDSHAGAGPRSTPAISNGLIFTIGATGILNALDGESGALIWSHKAAEYGHAELPGWAFCGSPLVVNDFVVVSLAGTLMAFNIEDGEIKWIGPDGGTGYSSPHLQTIDGVNQILLMCETGIISVKPENGDLLWEYKSQAERILQPAMIIEGEFLINDGADMGVRRISVNKSDSGWSVEDIWESTAIRPNFNDFIVHEGLAYGFTGPSLACIDIESGERIWKGDRYAGHLILLEDQDILVVLTEDGEIALVEAKREGFSELAKITAIEGRTWNHPVLVGDILIVRNSREMVAYKVDLL